MPTLTIDGREITVEPGTRIIEAADRLGIDIPRFCYHPGLPVAGNCRMCLVDTNRSPKPVASCWDPCQEGHVVTTNSPRILEARRSVLEYILLNHPVDCPICDQAGECELQDLYFAHDHQASRHPFHKHHKDKARVLGPQIIYDAERCINCTRCIRVCEEVAKAPQLVQVQRGERAYIDVFPGTQLDHPYSMCTADVCPVGALTTRDFRFKCRAWLTHGIQTVCGECSRGCGIRADVYRNEVQRLVPRHNPDVNQYWACDHGRLAYHRFETGRVAAVRIGGATTDYAKGVREVAEALPGAALRGVAVVLTPWMTDEDAWAVVTAIRSVAPGATFAVGGAAPGAADEVLVLADKNPNRNGLARVLADLAVTPVALDEIVAQAPALGALIVFGAEHAKAEALAGALARVPLSIVLAALEGPLTAAARFVFPSTSPYETDGTWVNEQGVVQRVRRAVQPAGDVRDFAVWASDLADRLGQPLPAPARASGGNP
jgi:NADH-quinone oxidoreductase subunit G